MSDAAPYLHWQPFFSPLVSGGCERSTHYPRARADRFRVRFAIHRSLLWRQRPLVLVNGRVIASRVQCGAHHCRLGWQRYGVGQPATADEGDLVGVGARELMSIAG